MSDEKKIIDLKEEDLEKVDGGYSYHVGGFNCHWICPKCGNDDHEKMKANDYKYTRIQCDVCWYEGAGSEFYHRI